MAGTSLLALIDDIASVLDDIAVLTKVAAKKTAGVLGDDLALNAEQVSGVRAERELPVVWGVAKGSMRNKLILVPAALLISALAPALISPLLMLGGLFLCFEGVEKLAHSLFHKADDHDEHLEKIQLLSNHDIDLAAFEKEKIVGAIRTDFVLSAEIIVIALGTVKDASLANQVIVVAGIACVMTVGVYSLVAAIVKLDDAGLYLVKNSGSHTLSELIKTVGEVLLRVAPYLMKTLSIVGTAAMFLVGGGILAHGLPLLQAPLHHAIESTDNLPGTAKALTVIVTSVINMVTGVLAGSLMLTIVSLGSAIVVRLKKS